MTQFDCDVLVVGLGPAGSTTSLALAQHGISVIGISKHATSTPEPRSHIVNLRGMEVLRQLGVEKEVKNLATPWSLLGEMPYLNHLAGEEFCRVKAWGRGLDQVARYESASPCTISDIPQNILEPQLVLAAARAGANILYGTILNNYVEHKDHVAVTIKNQGVISTVRCKYIVGADGANSRVAQIAGVTSDSSDDLGVSVYCHIRSNLEAHTSDRPGSLYWILWTEDGQARLGSFRMVQPWKEWIVGWVATSDEERMGREDLRRSAAQTIRRMIGSNEPDFELLRVSRWRAQTKNSHTYSTSRTILVGDAAHAQPPSGGLGTNLALQDAMNLSWKLAIHIKGWGGRILLDTYTAERQPAAAKAIAHSRYCRQQNIRIIELANQHPRDDVALMTAISSKAREFNALEIEMSDAYGPQNTSISSEWRPTLGVGRKFPHMFLPGEPPGTSTLDLISHLKFTLFVPDSYNEKIADIQALLSPTLVKVRHLNVSRHDLTNKSTSVPDAGRCELLILVRPDGYVAAMRHRLNSVSSIVAFCKDALKSLGIEENTTNRSV